MPAGGGFRKKLTLRVEHLSSVLLLPLFFAFIGLRTQVGLLNGAQDWLVCSASSSWPPASSAAPPSSAES